MAIYSSVILADSPIGYWRLNETSGTDAAPLAGANHGTYSGCTLNQPGLIPTDGDPAPTFLYASTSSIVIADAGSVFDFTGTSTFSLEIWFLLTDIATASRFIWSRTDATNGYWVYVDQSTQTIRFDRFGGGGSDEVTSAAISLNTVYHLVCTYDGTTMTVYLNGQASGTPLASSRSIAANVNNFTIGEYSGTGNWWSGTLDEPAVYNYALSAARVQAHYDAAVRAHPSPRGLPIGV